MVSAGNRVPGTIRKPITIKGNLIGPFIQVLLRREMTHILLSEMGFGQPLSYLNQEFMFSFFCNFAQSRAELKPLMTTYGYLGGNIQDTLINMLEMGLSPAQIKTIMGKLQATGASDADIMTFLNGIVSGGDGAYPDSPKAAAIVAFFKLASRDGAKYPLAQIVTQYTAIATIPGASRLLERIIIFSGVKNSYRPQLPSGK